MIRYVCDSCFESVEHAGPELPPQWASIIAAVHWDTGEGGSEYEQECDARLLCPKCRGGSQQALCVRVERVLSDGLDGRPKVVAK